MALSRKATSSLSSFLWWHPDSSQYAKALWRYSFASIFTCSSSNLFASLFDNVYQKAFNNFLFIFSYVISINQQIKITNNAWPLIIKTTETSLCHNVTFRCKRHYWLLCKCHYATLKIRKKLSTIMRNTIWSSDNTDYIVKFTGNLILSLPTLSLLSYTLKQNHIPIISKSLQTFLQDEDKGRANTK